MQAINEYRQAARNAIDAGFDGVEIHGANGVGGSTLTAEVALSRPKVQHVDKASAMDLHKQRGVLLVFAWHLERSCKAMQDPGPNAVCVHLLHV